MSEHIPNRTNHEKKPSELTIPQLALALKALGETVQDESGIITEAVAKLEKLQNINKLLGLLAPGGTAPRTALEEIWKQADNNGNESPVLQELRSMLTAHWGEWTPAIRKAEGIPPKS